MFFAGLKPDDIARPDFLDGTTPTLHAPDAASDDQRLAERMRVPGGPGGRLESDAGAGRARRRRSRDWFQGASAHASACLRLRIGKQGHRYANPAGLPAYLGHRSINSTTRYAALAPAGSRTSAGGCRGSMRWPLAARRSPQAARLVLAHSVHALPQPRDGISKVSVHRARTRALLRHRHYFERKQS
jgi:hypothetical protein